MPYSDPKEAARYRAAWKARKRATDKLSLAEKIRRGRELAKLVAARRKPAAPDSSER